MTATTSNENEKWSDRKMEGDGALRTVECLRGRLLAERQASRAAKDDAELIGKKLIELKKQLNEEIKLKGRAEKKLRLLKRKLECLKISSTSVKSEGSSSSKNSEVSIIQSITTSSGSNDPEAHESKSKDTESEISEEMSQNVADNATSEQSHGSLFTEETTTAQSTSSSSSSSSIECHSPEGFCHNPSHKSEDSEIGDNSNSTLKSSMAETLDYVDNTLALVPVSVHVTCHNTSTELKPVSESASSRNIRENLQSSMEKNNAKLKLEHANRNHK